MFLYITALKKKKNHTEVLKVYDWWLWKCSPYLYNKENYFCFIELFP